MGVVLAVPREVAPGERRVALVPEVVERLTKGGHEVRVAAGAGNGAFCPDADYQKAGAKIVDDPRALVSGARIIVRVQPPTPAEVDPLGSDAIVVGLLNPTRALDSLARLRDRKLTAFSLELLPRISRAQSMDALSSQATVA